MDAGLQPTPRHCTGRARSSHSKGRTGGLTQKGGVSAGDGHSGRPRPRQGGRAACGDSPVSVSPLTVKGCSEYPWFQTPASPGRDVIRTGSGGCEHLNTSSAQTGGAQTGLGSQSPSRSSFFAPEGRRDHRGPRPLPPVLLKPSTGDSGPSWEGAGRANCSRLWEPPIDLYQEGFLKVGGGASGRITQRGCKARQLLGEASSTTGTDHLTENRQRCVSFSQRNRAVFFDSSKIFPIRT